MVNRSRLRQFMVESFNSDELADLVFDYFPNARPLLGDGMTLSQKVRVLIDFADRHGRTDHLIAVLEKLRPEAYCDFFDTDLEPRPEPVTAKRNPDQVFISYANSDADFANQLAADLREKEIAVWMAPDSILPGEKWVAAIERGLRESGIFVLVLTPEGVESKWVSQETQVAIMLENEGKMRIVPLRLRRAEVPLFLSARQHIAFDRDYDRGLAALLALLRGQAQPAGAPRPARSDATKVAGHFPVIIIDSPDAPADEVSLDRPVITLGRAPDNDVVIDLPNVAAHHLRLETAEAGGQQRVSVTDLGSRTGTYVSGQRLTAQQPRRIEPGDMVSLGDRAGRSVSLIYRPASVSGAIKPVAASAAAAAMTAFGPVDATAPRQPAPAAQPAPAVPPAGARRVPLWAFGAAAVALIALIALFVLRPFGRGADATETPAAALAANETGSTRAAPTSAPAVVATAAPTEAPTVRPTAAPTRAPTATSQPPTPTVAPTAEPTVAPTATTAVVAENGCDSGSNTTTLGADTSLDFENCGRWQRGDEANGSLAQSTAQARSGDYSAALSYDFETADNDYVLFQQQHAIDGEANVIRVWVYGDGSGHFLNAWITDQAGETWQVPLGRVTHQGWKQMEGSIATGQPWPWIHISGPDNGTVDYPIRFRGLVLDDLNPDYTGSGTIYLDDLSVATGAAVAATDSNAAPVAATTATAVAPDVGQIIFTAGGVLYTADLGSPARRLGTASGDSCAGEATADGVTYSLVVPGPGCGRIGDGLALCASPNGAYEVLSARSDAGRSVTVRPAGGTDADFIYDGTVDQTEGILWSPGSDSFLFVVGDDVYQGFPSGGTRVVITGQTGLFCPRWTR